jgi:hypothetical protein
MQAVAAHMPASASLPDEIEVGWVITDPDGNVVAAGGVSKAKPTAWVGEMLAEAARNEGEQE